ncbi:MAG: methylated-DNA--[protein]-cysteine S-methyltransferase [Jatrophihabitans sp.]|nr:MAG: methylated-DNA--[protein]-cysteine S-methyltransferase [Jatrophihabitans sp.]
MKYRHLDSPLGALLLTRDDRGLAGLYLPTGRRPKQVSASWTRDDGAFADVAAQLGEYFAGRRHEFDLPLSPHGSAFQLRVWQALRAIEYGQTTTYGAIARSLGIPAGPRAVGLANGQNPISIIVPCHRVIGADGSLTGYGGGLPAKQWLLSHEAAHSGLFAGA